MWMAKTSFAWPSVTVKRGAIIIVSRKSMKIGWDNVFGELLTAVDPDLHSEVIRRVPISKSVSISFFPLPVTSREKKICETVNQFGLALVTS